MSNCNGQLEALSALLDGELGPEEELELRRHIDGCDTCRAWQAQLDALSIGVANSIGRERAPRPLLHRVRRLQKTSPRHGPRAAAVAVGSAFLAAGLLFGRMPGNDTNASRLVEDHRRFVSGETTLALLSSDPGALARDLAARLPFELAIAEVEGARLLGGQDCSLANGPAAYLQYELQYEHEGEHERVSVFVARRLPPLHDAADANAEPCQMVSGAALCTFTGPQQTVAVVASNPATAQAFRRAAWIVDSD